MFIPLTSTTVEHPVNNNASSRVKFLFEPNYIYIYSILQFGWNDATGNDVYASDGETGGKKPGQKR